MKKIGIVGHFGGNKAFFDGQTVKTKNIHRALTEEFSESEIKKLDTYDYKRNPLSFFCRTVKLIFDCKNVIMLPDENGVRVFAPIFGFLNVLLKRKLHYAVVGGWLPVFLKRHRIIACFLKRFSGVYVETTSMKTALEEMKFSNVFILPNFKYLDVISEAELEYNVIPPLRLCIFSRIMEQKGVEEAINTVSAINDSAGKTVYELDIYGPVDSEYEQRFCKLQDEFPKYVRYLGTIDSDKSVQTIKKYFALIFPTKFYTEGIPGTLIDACAAGVPVITSLWANYHDVFKEGVTGWGFEFGKFEQFKALLEKAADDPEEFSKMKLTALGEMKKFQPQEAIRTLTQGMS